MSQLTNSETIALGEYLTEWDDTLTFDQVLENIDSAVVFYLAEDWPQEDLIRAIKDLKETIDDAF